MKKLDHKLVCWGDYAIPVSIDANWIAWDRNGTIWTYSDSPEKNGSEPIWVGNCDSRIVIPMYLHIPPPEPGPWHKQVYWIG